MLVANSRNGRDIYSSSRRPLLRAVARRASAKVNVLLVDFKDGLAYDAGGDCGVSFSPLWRLILSGWFDDVIVL